MHVLTGHMDPGVKLKLLGMAASAMNEWAISQAQSTQLRFVVVLIECIYICIYICLNLYIPKYHQLSPYNIVCVYIFREN